MLRFGFALLLLAFLPGHLLAQVTSLHYKRTGKNVFYDAANGGFETLTNIPYSSLKCGKCHGDSLANGIPVVDSTYTPGCNDCHATFSAGGVPSPKSCLKCHGRTNAEINYAKSDPSFADVHYAKGMTCTVCHTREQLHGDLGSRLSMLDPDPNKPACEKCHTSLPSTYAHTTHTATLTCTACHTKSVQTCYNCHFESELASGGKIKRPIRQMRNFVLLTNRNGKVQASTFMALTYQGKAFYTIAPYVSHSIVKEGRQCSDCHNNARVQEYNTTGAIKITWWDTSVTPNAIRNTTGVVPVPPDWRQALKFDFVTYTGDPTLPTDPTKWVYLKSVADTAQMLSQYAQPLTPAQMAKLAIPISAVGEKNGALPLTFELLQNYPNPFNPETVIAFALAKPAVVNLRVFNMLGGEVAVPVKDQALPSGIHRVKFVADHLPTGVYFYQLQAAGFTAVRKMLLVR
ncbi:MAG: T9SS type A sorting domain-containing protein [candidate division KSB1 bacterium]|nr:T9SS type A sorting domain-containing protein [candidate division KSB1 bacterium]